MISLVIGTVSLLFAAAGAIAAFHEAGAIKADAVIRKAAYADEFEDRAAANESFGAVAAGFLVAASLLIIGARSLHRQKSSGIVWLWAYVPVQLVCAAALAATMMWAIYHSPGGMLFFIGVIPGGIAAIYPFVLIVLLAQASSPES